VSVPSFNKMMDGCMPIIPPPAPRIILEECKRRFA
jgi:hypothetical protein